MQPLGKAEIQLMEVCDYLFIQPPTMQLPMLHASTLLHTHKPGQKGINIPLHKPTGNAQNSKRNTHMDVLHRLS